MERPKRVSGRALAAADPVMDRSIADFEIWAEILDLNMREELQDDTDLSRQDAYAAFRVALRKTASDIWAGVVNDPPVPISRPAPVQPAARPERRKRKRYPAILKATVAAAGAVVLLSCGSIAAL